MPGTLIFDRGTHFTAQTIVNLTRALGLRGIYTSTYNPRANGLVERGHGPLISILAKMEYTRPSEWYKWLSCALFAGRTTTKPATGHSPFEVVYGR